MDCRNLYFSKIIFALLFILSSAPVRAAAPAKTAATKAPSQDIKAAPVFLTCFTINPVDLPKGEPPRSCNSYCMEKLAVCSGVQSNIAPSPACEDGIAKGHGNCRCCKVQQ